MAVPIGKAAIADPEARSVMKGDVYGGSSSSAATGKAVPVGPRFNASYLHNTPPPYPAPARRLRLEGTATIRVLVGTDGRPRSVRLEKSSGVAILDEAALKAVRGWTFVAARQGSDPVAAEVNVPVRFRLASTAPE
jgi:protein TonB